MGWLIFAQRQNCNCNARENKSSAWINGAKRLRATMERERVQLCICSCVHTHRSGVMGTSSCDCVSIYIYREGGVLEKNSDNFCSSFLVLNTVNVKGRVRAHTCVGEYDNLNVTGYPSCLQQGSHSIPHTCAEKLRFWSGGSYFRIGGRGSSTRVSTAWTKHKQTW